MIFDCFLFMNELDLLEIRLNSLAPYVDAFVLLEAPVTFRGKEKPLVFNDNKDRFKGFNIVHIIKEPFYSNDPWEVEFYYRNALAEGVQDADGEAIVLLSDIDEIPDFNFYREGEEGVFINQQFYYYFNCQSSKLNNWHGTLAIKRERLRTSQLTRWRLDRREMDRFVGDERQGGWHFSTIGSLDQFIHKFESFSHTDIDNPIQRDRLINNRKRLMEPYRGVWKRNGRRSKKPLIIEMPTGPKWLLDNKEKYEHLFYKGGSDVSC